MKAFDFRVDRQSIKYLLLFSLPLLPHSIAGWGKGAIEKGFVTSMISISDNGILATASISLVVVGVISSAIFSAFNPEVLKLLLKLDLGNECELKLIKRKIVKMSLIVLLVMTFVILLAYPFNYLFFKYYLDASYLPGLVYVPYLLSVAFFSLFYTIFSLYVMNEKKTIQLSTITFTTTGLEIISSYFAIKYSGIIGLLYVNIIFSLLRSISVAVYANMLRPLPWFYMLNPKNI